MSSHTDTTDEIWSKLVDGVQDGRLSIGDAYRMKSTLFEELQKAREDNFNKAIEILMEEEKMSEHSCEDFHNTGYCRNCVINENIATINKFLFNQPKEV